MSEELNIPDDLKNAYYHVYSASNGEKNELIERIARAEAELKRQTTAPLPCTLSEAKGSAWQMMNVEQLFLDAKRQHAAKLDCERWREEDQRKAEARCAELENYIDMRKAADKFDAPNDKALRDAVNKYVPGALGKSLKGAAAEHIIHLEDNLRVAQESMDESSRMIDYLEKRLAEYEKTVR